MRVCVDTTVLIDILKDEFRSYQEQLYSALASNEVLIAPTVVFAELMPQFDGDTKSVKTFLKDHNIRIEPLDLKSVVVSGQRWLTYLKRKSKIKCPECKHQLNIKEHVLSDFYIGGFALAHCEAILTRDRGIYKKYFPDLRDYSTAV